MPAVGNSLIVPDDSVTMLYSFILILDRRSDLKLCSVLEWMKQIYSFDRAGGESFRCRTSNVSKVLVTLQTPLVLFGVDSKVR